jgi:hypothetical protein
MQISKNELIEVVAFVLWRSLDLRPRKRSLDDARLWARRVVEHLELCGIEWARRPPAPPHSTPQPHE